MVKKVKTGQNSESKAKKKTNKPAPRAKVWLDRASITRRRRGRSVRREKKFGSRIGMVCGA